MNSAVDKGFSIAFINTALSGLLHYSFVLGNNVFFFPFSTCFTAVLKFCHSKWPVQELLKEIINRPYNQVIIDDQFKATRKWSDFFKKIIRMSPYESGIPLLPTQPAITFSKLTIETRCEICSKLTIKTLERRHYTSKV